MVNPMPDDGPCGEGTVHQVSWEPIPKQREFPAGVQEIELSWSRSKAYMRLRVLPDETEWYLKEMLGKVEIVRADPQSGRMYFRAKCVVTNEDGYATARFWKPQRLALTVAFDAYTLVEPTPLPEGIRSRAVQVELDPSAGVHMDGDVVLPASHWRVCFRRPRGDWRTRNERNDKLYHVAGYTPGGIMNINWKDGGSHIFHDGPIYMDGDLNVLFIDPDEV